MHARGAYVDPLSEGTAFGDVCTVNSGKKVTDEATETDDELMSRWSSDASGIDSALPLGAKEGDDLPRTTSAGTTAHATAHPRGSTWTLGDVHVMDVMIIHVIFNDGFLK